MATQLRGQRKPYQFTLPRRLRFFGDGMFLYPDGRILTSDGVEIYKLK